MKILKYPRTHHLQGSRLQPGDEDLEALPFEAIEGRHLVVEEKVDGANCAVSGDDEGGLLLQSRGHYLVGGSRERHFDRLKTWAHGHEAGLLGVLGTRYVMYGEWLYAKHTVFYDRLPHHLLEFDVLDRERGEFLSTPRRRALLGGLPVCPVPVLHEGPVASLAALVSLVGPSRFKSPGWREALRAAAARVPHVDVERTVSETDPTDDMEGLYVKVEEGGQVVERYKWIRAGFLQVVVSSDSHWHSRPIVPNQLAP